MIHRPSLGFIYHACVAYNAAKTRQSSKAHLIWILLPNIMQTLQVFVFPPTFLKASLGAMTTLCRTSTPKTLYSVLTQWATNSKCNLKTTWNENQSLVLDVGFLPHNDFRHSGLLWAQMGLILLIDLICQTLCKLSLGKRLFMYSRIYGIKYHVITESILERIIHMHKSGYVVKAVKILFFSRFE